MININFSFCLKFIIAIHCMYDVKKKKINNNQTGLKNFKHKNSNSTTLSVEVHVIK